MIALEHLIHIMLFGEEMRLEAIRVKLTTKYTFLKKKKYCLKGNKFVQKFQCSGLKAVYSFCQLNTTPPDTLRLLLRALAVMCNANKGSQQVLSVSFSTFMIDCILKFPASIITSIFWIKLLKLTQ